MAAPSPKPAAFIQVSATLEMVVYGKGTTILSRGGRLLHLNDREAKIVAAEIERWARRSERPPPEP